MEYILNDSSIKEPIVNFVHFLDVLKQLIRVPSVTGAEHSFYSI